MNKTAFKQLYKIYREANRDFKTEMNETNYNINDKIDKFENDQLAWLDENPIVKSTIKNIESIDLLINKLKG